MKITLMILLFPIIAAASCIDDFRIARIATLENLLRAEAPKGLTPKRVQLIRYLSFFTDREAELALAREIQREDPLTRRLAVQALDDIQQVKYLTAWGRRHRHER